MKNTTLCYLESGNLVLLLCRNKRPGDLNAGKWIGVGGHCLEGESPEECAYREIGEETGLTGGRLTMRGVVTFDSDEAEGEYMFLFTGTGFDGQLTDCDEGELAWVEKDRMHLYPTWEGDAVFLRLLKEGHPFFSLKLSYRSGKLTAAVLDGTPLAL